jgi:hypothetical protein
MTTIARLGRATKEIDTLGGFSQVGDLAVPARFASDGRMSARRFRHDPNATGISVLPDGTIVAPGGFHQKTSMAIGPVGSNLITVNPGFELGNGENWSINSRVPPALNLYQYEFNTDSQHDGVYCYRCISIPAGGQTTISVPVGPQYLRIYPTNNYYFSLWSKGRVSELWILFRNRARTSYEYIQYVINATYPDWTKNEIIIMKDQIPAMAYYVELYKIIYGPQTDCYTDDVNIQLYEA